MTNELVEGVPFACWWSLETKWYKKMRQKQIFECVNELGRLELNLIGVENDTEYHISNEFQT
jgi:hypothetical protein